MKHKKIILLISIICVTFLVSCGSNNSTSSNNTPTYKESNTNSEKETSISDKQNKKEDQSELKEDKKNEVKTTPLFEDVYAPYTDSIRKISFDSLVDNIKYLGYKYKIKKPTEEDLGIVTVYDNKNNKVSFTFYPIEKIELLSLLCYTNGKDEISVSDDLHILKEPKYTNFKYGAENPNTEVFSIEDQKAFMFK